jgi:hypothetical protein
LNAAREVSAKTPPAQQASAVPQQKTTATQQ